MDVLADEPLIVHACGAHVGVLARHYIRCGEAFEVFTAVVGIYVKSFVRTPNESFVEVCSLQVGYDLILPFLCANGREFAQ